MTEYQSEDNKEIKTTYRLLQDSAQLIRPERSDSFCEPALPKKSYQMFNTSTAQQIQSNTNKL